MVYTSNFLKDRITILNRKEAVRIDWSPYEQYFNE